MHLYERKTRLFSEDIMNIEFEKCIGKKIKELRVKEGLTQEQLSAKFQIHGCDITRSALAKIEVGQRHIYPDELKLFTELLNTDYNELLNIN